MAMGIRKTGDFCWINMLTPRPAEAMEFFGRVLGWTYFEKLGRQKVLQVQSGVDPPKKVALGERAAMVDGADYIAFGSFFPSTIKPDAVRTTPALLTVAKARWNVPVVAIGGVDASNAGACIRAGAFGVAAIRAATDPELRAAVDAAL